MTGGDGVPPPTPRPHHPKAPPAFPYLMGGSWKGRVHLCAACGPWLGRARFLDGEATRSTPHNPVKPHALPPPAKTLDQISAQGGQGERLLLLSFVHPPSAVPPPASEIRAWAWHAGEDGGQPVTCFYPDCYSVQSKGPVGEGAIRQDPCGDPMCQAITPPTPRKCIGRV